MSSIHPSHRRVRHLRQIVCRGLQKTDPEGCFYVISAGGKELYCSGVSRDCNNPHWDALPIGFLDEHSNLAVFNFVVNGWSTSEALFSVDIDLRHLLFLHKTFAGLPSLKPGPSVLFRCQDGVYDTSGATKQEVDDWVVVKDNAMTAARQERTTVDAIQGSGIVLAALKIELEILQHRFQHVQWEADHSVPSASTPPIASGIERDVKQKESLIEALRFSIAERKALHAQRASIVQSQSKANDFALSTPLPPSSSAQDTLESVKVRRRTMIRSLRSLFAMGDNRINGSLVPEKDGYPETAEHAIAMGYIAHILSIVCEVAAITPPHPIIVCGDHSKIAERAGLPLAQYIPLYNAKGVDKMRLKKGFELLKGNALCIAAALSQSRLDSGWSFTETIERILSS